MEAERQTQHERLGAVSADARAVAPVKELATLERVAAFLRVADDLVAHAEVAAVRIEVPAVVDVDDVLFAD